MPRVQLNLSSSLWLDYETFIDLETYGSFFPCYYAQGQLRCCQGPSLVPELHGKQPWEAMDWILNVEPSKQHNLECSLVLFPLLSPWPSPFPFSLAVLSSPTFYVLSFNLPPLKSVVQQSSASKLSSLKGKSWLSVPAARKVLFAFCFCVPDGCFRPPCLPWDTHRLLLPLILLRALSFSEHQWPGKSLPLNTSCQIQRAKTSQAGIKNWGGLAPFLTAETGQFGLSNRVCLLAKGEGSLVCHEEKNVFLCQFWRSKQKFSWWHVTILPTKLSLTLIVCFFCCYFLEGQGLTMSPRLALNLWSFWFRLLSVGIPGLGHHA